METSYDDGKGTHKIEASRREEDKFLIRINGEEHEIQADFVGPGKIQFRWQNRLYKAVVAQEGDERFVFFQGQVYRLSRRDEGVPQIEASAGDPLSAPMPGRVVEICVKEGDVVEESQDLVVLEAMKMETRILAPFIGLVTKINFKAGDQVNQGDILIELEPS